MQHDVGATLSIARDILGLHPDDLACTLDTVSDETWVDQIKASYVPVQVGR
jgi:hypothetical protein